MTAHVFIVGDDTFPVHLQYQFAGIGARKDDDIDFNQSSYTDLHYSKENNLVKMIADVSRIRKGDRVFFYLQSSGYGGQFYGVFRAREDSAFLDNGRSKQYLLDTLGKSLTFRVLIEPDTVYPCGVTEWDALDKICELDKPHHMLWSLIYRKLRGNRGCTMITDYEENRLCSLIRADQQPLNCANRGLSFDAENRKIACSNGPSCYEGKQEDFDLTLRIVKKSQKGNSFEAHLQADIIGRLGRAEDELTRILLGENHPEWIGNEVGCGVGMQSIDVMVTYRKNGLPVIMPIELKSVRSKSSNIRQIKRYVDWIKQYYVPNHEVEIEPLLIAKKRIRKLPEDFLHEVKEFNRTTGALCMDFQLVEFEVANGKVCYEKRVLPK